MAWLASIDLWGIWMALTSLAIWAFIIGYAAKTVRRRYLAQTLGRLVRAIVGAIIVAVAILGIGFGIDRLVVDLHRELITLALAVVTTATTFWTFHRLDRAPAQPSTPPQ